jgi:ferritin-like metal-binding protein YciE
VAVKICRARSVIENAEVVGYDMLIQWAMKVNVDKVIPVLMQIPKEEEDMRMWLRADTPRLFAESWPRIEEEVNADMMSGAKETEERSNSS